MDNKVMTPDGAVELAVGLGATMGVGSDRYPYTVVAFNKTGKTITVVRDNFTADKEGGHDFYGTQKWIFTPGNSTNTEIARWSAKRGCYQIDGTRLYVGKREAYQDPSF